MEKAEAAAYLAGAKQVEGAEASAPTNLHVISGEVVEKSENGKVKVDLGGLVFNGDDEQAVEIDTLGGLEVGDTATILLTGQENRGMTPLGVGGVGTTDRISQRVSSIEADYVKATLLEAQVAQIGFLKADSATITELQAQTAKIQSLTAEQLSAATAYIADLTSASITAQTLMADVAKVHNLTADQLSAAAGYISQLTADSVTAQKISAMYGDFATVKANAAKVANLTAQELEADHATIASLDSNYAHITNGVIDNASISYADVDDLSANYAHVTNGVIDNASISYADVDNLSANYAQIQNGKINSALIDTAAIVDEQVFTVTGNKATISEIDAARINVSNLHAANLIVDKVNGQPVIGGYSYISKDSSGYSSKNPKALGWYELTSNGFVESNDTTVDDTKSYYTSGEATRLYDQNYIDGLAEDLSDRIDGAIETFTSSVVPTPSNYPASDWTTNDIRATHVGDVCYVLNEDSNNNGWCYRYAYNTTTQQYEWALIKDSDVTAALSRLLTVEGVIGDVSKFDEDIATFLTDENGKFKRLQTRTTSLETRAANLETNKVDVSTFNSVSQTVDENVASINTLTTTTQELRTDFDNIDVGARNLIRGMANPRNDSEMLLVRASTEDDGVIRLTPTTSSATATSRSRYLDFVEFEAEEYTLSFDIRIADVESTYSNIGPAYAYIGYSDAASWNVQLANSTHHVWGRMDITSELTTDWKRVHFTRNPVADKVGGTLVPSNGCTLRVHFLNSPSAIPIDIRHIKLERGNKPTDWSPAPEDAERKPNLLRGTNQNIELAEFGETEIGWKDGGWGVQSGTAANGDAELIEVNDGPDGQLYAFHVWSINSNNKDVSQRRIKAVLTPDDTYQVSYFARLTPGVEQASAVVQFRLYGSSALKTSTFALTSDEWKDFVFPFSITEDQYTNNEEFTFLIGVKGVGDIQICGVKLERSDYATGWTASAYDNVPAISVTTISNTVNTVRQTATSNSATISQLTQTLGTNADGTTKTNDIVQRTAKIEQDLDGITTTVDRIDSEMETVSNPNLAPYFSMPIDDVYDAADNVNGYWKRVTTDAQFTTYDMQVEHNGSSGWAHFAGTATSSNPYVRFEPLPIETLKPSTKYTFVVEVDVITANVTNIKIQLTGGQSQTDTKDQFATALEQYTKETGIFYKEATTVSDFSSATGLSRSYFQIYGTGAFDAYVRISLFEGEYKGQYKPYVDQTLSTRVKAAETSIVQNAEAISLNARSTESLMTFVPTKHPRTDTDFWYSLPSTFITPLADGWFHYEYTNTGTSAASAYIAPKNWGQIIPGEKCTFLIEVKNTSGMPASGNFAYMQEMGGAQFWGNAVVKANGTLQTTYIRYQDFVDGAFTKRFVKLADVDHLSTTTYQGMCFRYRLYLAPSATVSFDIRMSVYPGDYEGPYNEYLTATSSAQLMVANDEIDARVEKNGVIAAINASVEEEGGSAVKIIADKVNIEGATIFTSGRLSSTSLNNAYDAKGAAQEAVDNLQVGGRNLLLNTSNEWSEWITPDVNVDNRTVYWYISKNDELATWATVGQSCAFSMEVEFDGVTASSSGTFAFRPQECLKSVSGATNGSSNNVDWNWGPAGDVAAGYITTPPSDGVVKISNVKLITTDRTSRYALQFSIRCNYWGSGRYRIRRVKYELSTKVTDWTPAPEDVEASTLASGVEYIEGTQTAATNLWTGVTKESALVEGKTIAYKLPYAGNSTAATLNLTLAGGGTTGAKAVQMLMSTSSNTGAWTNITTHWPVGSIIPMTYDGTKWCVQNYNTNVNQIERTQHSNTCMAASANATGKSYAVASSSVIGYVKSLGGYQTIVSGTTIDLSYPILWGTGNVAASKTFTNAYEIYPSCTLRTNIASWTGTQYAMAYLVGTILGNLFTVDSAVFTSTEPTTEDGKFYIPIGQLYSTYQIAFRTTKDLYAYLDGKFRQVTPTEIVASQYIYKSCSMDVTSLDPTTTWVTTATASQNTWTTTRPEYDAGYPVIFVAQQKKRLDTTVICTTPVRDLTTTIIDGRNIITGSINAEKINAEDLKVNAANIIGNISIGAIGEGAQALQTILNNINQSLANLQSGLAELDGVKQSLTFDPQRGLVIASYDEDESDNESFFTQQKGDLMTFNVMDETTGSSTTLASLSGTDGFVASRMSADTISIGDWAWMAIGTDGFGLKYLGD